MSPCNHLVNQQSRNSPILLIVFEKGCAFAGIGTSVELDPSQKLTYVSFKGVTKIHEMLSKYCDPV